MYYLVQFPAAFGTRKRAVGVLLYRLDVLNTVAHDFNVRTYIHYLCGSSSPHCSTFSVMPCLSGERGAYGQTSAWSEVYCRYAFAEA